MIGSIMDKGERMTQACCLVLATRACPPVGNEAGMCPGINGFTECAPIADWSGRAKGIGGPAAASRGGIGWRTRGGVCHVCVQRPVAEARTHRKMRDVCATQWGRQKGLGWRTRGGVCHVCVRRPVVAARTTSLERMVGAHVASV